MIQFQLPKIIKIQIQNNCINFLGYFGTNSLKIPLNFLVTYDNNTHKLIIISNSKKKNKMFIKTFIALIKKQIIGVSKKFKKTLYLNGIGYKAQILIASFDNSLKILNIKLGFSHDINILIPKNIIINLNSKAKEITLISENENGLTQFIAFLKKYKRTDPYKGKGILFKNEKIHKKEGKKTKT